MRLGKRIGQGRIDPPVGASDRFGTNTLQDHDGRQEYVLPPQGFNDRRRQHDSFVRLLRKVLMKQAVFCVLVFLLCFDTSPATAQSIGSACTTAGVF